MKADLPRAAEDARRCAARAEEYGVPRVVRRAFDRWRTEQKAAGRSYEEWSQDVTSMGKCAMTHGSMIYTGGMGGLGAGTLPEQVPAIQAMTDEFDRVYWDRQG